MSFEPTAFQPTAFEIDGSPTPPNAYARMMANLLPPGRVWRLIGEGLLYPLLAACADELGRLDARALVLYVESTPDTADELLPEYEAELGLVASGTTAERRARVVARHVARQRFRPVDFQLALASILGQDAADVVVIETSPAVAASMGDAREVFRFFIYRDPSEPGSYDIEAAQALIDQIKPSHTIGHAIESVDFCCDDEHSLCDRDLLGA